MSRSEAGKEGLAAAFVAMGVMAAFSINSVPDPSLAGSAGICSRGLDINLFPLPLSWLLNNILIIGIAAALIFANKKFVFVQGQDYVFPALFLITTASNPALTGTLNPSTVLCAANLGCMCLLFNAYGRPNATMPLFVAGTIAGLGAMIQYAFILFIPVYLVAAGTLQLLRPKELAAFMLGLVAPYWTLLGLGVIDFSSFSLPHIESVFTESGDTSDLTLVLVEAVLAVAGCLFATVHNSVTIYTTGIRIMLFNRVICIFGGAAVLFACVDFLNFGTYLTTLYMCAAIQAANAFQATGSKYTRYILGGIALIYILLYICILTS